MLKVFERKKGIFRKGSIDDIDSREISWLNCYSPTSEELSKISKKIKIPKDKLLHFIDETARPHILNTREFSVVFWSMPNIVETRLKKDMIAIFFLPNNNILTLSNNEISVIKEFEERVIKNGEIIRTPASFLHNLMNETVTKLFSIMDQLEEQIDITETDVLKKPERGLIAKIFSIKKDILLLHKAIVADREVIIGIEKGFLGRIPEREITNFRLLYNDLVQLIDISETYRDIATGIIEIYLSTISNALNNSVKKLTAWGGLILIPTLIASIYGMNFQRVSEFNMPELYWPFGYFFSLGLMAFSVLILYIYFRKKRWL